MKTIALILFTFLSMIGQAQESTKFIPMINVSGEGKVYVTPDQASIQVSIETKGKNAADVKKLNDQKTEAVLNSIKKLNIDPKDFQTKRVSLNPQYDYETKKHSYNASQTIQILLKDLSKYDALMEAMVNAGINQINNVEFKSSKLATIQSDARKLAIKDAKLKAEDYVSVVGQKVGKALTITDNSQVYYPQPLYAQMKTEMDASSAPRETLAIGEMIITANVSVSFSLD